MAAQGNANSDAIERLKTAFIYNFTKFIYWPHEDAMKEFRIGVMGSERLAEQLRELETAARFRNRLPIRVISSQSPSQLANCQIIVVDGMTNDNLWGVYSSIRGKGVLMIAENLIDYKKSMISFLAVDSKMKFIMNKTKMDESNLTVNEHLYALAITKEGEWKSIFEKFNSILAHGGQEVKVEKSELREFMTMYHNLEQEKRGREQLMSQLEDSLNRMMYVVDAKIQEYKRLSFRINRQKDILAELGVRMIRQKKEIDLQESQIGRQRTVILLIAGLSFIGIVLLLITVRVNGQRRKANKLLLAQKTEIERQKHLVDLKQKEILDSINYARRIQNALMASNKLLDSHLPEYFVMFKPKDIVAGDFYWAAPLKDGFLYITADSTGHGVPGAFMSLLNISKLNDAINQKRIHRPDLVLNEVKSEIIKALNPDGSSEEGKDGMDAVLCKVDFANLKLQYAAANNSFCIVRKGELLLCRPDKMPVGKSHDDAQLFTYNEISIEKGDMIYTFTDGYADQFGGPDGKKLKQKKLKNLLVTVSALNMSLQKESIRKFFLDWKGDLEQVDDVLVIGVRV